MAVKEIYQTSVKVYDTDFQGIAHYASYYRFYKTNESLASSRGGDAEPFCPC
jgi:acyl-CoA thioesterase FadM